MKKFGLNLPTRVAAIEAENGSRVEKLMRAASLQDLLAMGIRTNDFDNFKKDHPIEDYSYAKKFLKENKLLFPVKKYMTECGERIMFAVTTEKDRDEYKYKWMRFFKDPLTFGVGEVEKEQVQPTKKHIIEVYDEIESAESDIGVIKAEPKKIEIKVEQRTGVLPTNTSYELKDTGEGFVNSYMAQSS